jgi:hypothetical protein
MGVQEMANEDAVTSAMQSNLGNKRAFYIFPGPGMAKGATRAEKEAAMKKAEEKMAAGPSGLLIYYPKRIFNFPKKLGIEFATEVLESLLLVFLLAQTQIRGFAGKVGFILTAGILAAIATNVPYMNWYGFPREYTLGYMFTQIVGFFLVGIVAGLIMKTQAATTAPAV